MADHVREWRVWLARPREAVFAFFADPANLALLTPPSLHLSLATPAPAITAGTVVEYRLCWLGLPLRWRALIREWDPPYRFIHVQVRGPLARWEHRHLFLEEDGGTWVEDRVTYGLPLGPLGEVAHVLLARRWLEALWEYRTRRLGELVGPIRPPTG